MKGYVYILTNDHMPGLLKIGRTTGDPETRAQQLYQTGVPSPFNVSYSVLSPDCQELESEMHFNFEDKRISQSREFFEIDLPTAIKRLDALLSAQVNNWLDDFMPGHKAVYDLDIPCPVSIAKLSFDTGERSYIITAAMEILTPDEIAPAVQRFKKIMADREARIGKNSNNVLQIEKHAQHSET